MDDEQPIHPPAIDWRVISTVLLDMDGTLLDRHFDDYFWEQYVPVVYARKHRLTVPQARTRLLRLYRAKERTLEWTDLDYWSATLGLDIPALKLHVEHLIAVHPHVPEFLAWARTAGKQVVMVTNAHHKTLEIKMERTALAGYFDRIVRSHELGAPKEDPDFWRRLHQVIDYDAAGSLLADDTEAVLESASKYGIRHCIHIARPSSALPPKPSSRFPAIHSFRELLPRPHVNIPTP